MVPLLQKSVENVPQQDDRVSFTLKKLVQICQITESIKYPLMANQNSLSHLPTFKKLNKV